MVLQQPGGSQFLNAPLLLLTDAGGTLAGSDGKSYRCPVCQKTFSLISSLLQHQKNTQCQQTAQHVNLRQAVFFLYNDTYVTVLISLIPGLVMGHLFKRSNSFMAQRGRALVESIRMDFCLQVMAV